MPDLPRISHLAVVRRVLLPAVVLLGPLTDAALAVQCPRGQYLRVRRHACVSRTAFQSYLRYGREEPEAPVRPREANHLPAKPAPTPIPPRRPVSIEAPPAAPAEARAASAKAPAASAKAPAASAKAVEALAAAAKPPTVSVDTQAAVLKAADATIAPSVPPPAPRPHGPASPFGELQVH